MEKFKIKAIYEKPLVFHMPKRGEITLNELSDEDIAENIHLFGPYLENPQISSEILNKAEKEKKEDSGESKPEAKEEKPIKPTKNG